MDVIHGFEYHGELNPAIWANEDQMRLDVQVTLLRSAMAFYEFLDVEGLKIEGVRFTGSNASYNYTKWSDCDIHIVIDFESEVCPELADNFFMTKKALWNKMHEGVEVNGYSVELYCEDVNNPVMAAGVFDLLNGEWLSKPVHEEPLWDDRAVETKVNYLIHEIDGVVAGASITEIAQMTERLRTMRRAGLARGGEFSTENLAFKALRNLGALEKLSQARTAAMDEYLSLHDEKCGEALCEAPQRTLDRCTVVTCNAFAEHYHLPPITQIQDVPMTGVGVLEYMRKHGLRMVTKALDMIVAKDRVTVRQFVNQHPHGTWYISTANHAMAVIDGQLFDAANRGLDGRIVQSALEFKR